ncbi:uncharacterized protein STEHIDRAFT_125090 [Stereum hirsutum FP-91666 SS1]|uniref:uncharacterized protein n=1 Tax=Stereum hirsutum (strain FP-91666) TaxID=721885 RepID=UPI000444A57C|nr:uncharacterized protein STEHIDRAFT_125090 [Stereum hirsutum FP-91666 SS1]EIM81512.1 hypothetical protein STEHIDRAFT_125090 [Stereum hirsutum FP-91666 SS1]
MQCVRKTLDADHNEMSRDRPSAPECNWSDVRRGFGLLYLWGTVGKDLLDALLT